MWIPKIEINEDFQMFLLEKYNITDIKSPLYSILYDELCQRYTIFISDDSDHNLISTADFYLSDYQNWIRSKKIKKLRCLYLEKM